MYFRLLLLLLLCLAAVPAVAQDMQGDRRALLRLAEIIAHAAEPCLLTKK